MKNSMPVGEINLDEIAKSTKNCQEKLSEKREESIKEKVRELNLKSLEHLANNKTCNGYMPYLFDFKFVLNKIRSNQVVDNMDESLKIKRDIAEQIAKMTKVPSLDTECHIESKDIDKNTSIKSLILKKICRQKKYRLVFHKR